MRFGILLAALALLAFATLTESEDKAINVAVKYKFNMEWNGIIFH